MVVFMGLLRDIFPGVDPPRQRDMPFEDVIRATAAEMGLEPEEDFVRQVVQVRRALWGGFLEGARRCLGGAAAWLSSAVREPQ